MDTIASFFSFITTPVSWIIVQFHSLYGAVFGESSGWAWGLSIVSLVILIRICLIPLFVKQIKATRAMQTLQPEMKKIQERYKNDKQRQSEEMMKLYKESGTNPLSSCLPILAQSPFFFALYHVLNTIAQGKTIGVLNQDLVDSARQAHIFGAPLASKFTDSASVIEQLDASVMDVRVVTVIMIVLMSLSQFFTQRQLMTKNVDTTVKTPFMQQQKMLMYVFPIIFAVFGINFPVGVLVYWLTTNVWTMGQQMYVIHNNPTPGSTAQAAYLERLSKKVERKGSVSGRGRRAIVKAIVAKGRDRNPAERKFINGLNKMGLAAQPDGTVVKSEKLAADQSQDGDTTHTGAAKRQQPKRQTKAQRQAAVKAEAEAAAENGEPQADKPAADKSQGGATRAGGPGNGARSRAQSGRKGPQQRSKSSSKK
ncbi:membrane protein insertase YidC [Streptomyces sp. MJP52]|uniref:membrane protein insertase YidC n=1 Tax=Streptomyces sp. MJP52 TaxID=2940555 RepID=UPI0024771013|nr:membrane protein insertase YidC [Streptomyces sp. MJP52]MDH6226056.1 YidC/Oxa1 family membrane protein insertase [Streptomyces sp. MJP52]